MVAVSELKNHLFEISNPQSAHARIAKMHRNMYARLHDMVLHIEKKGAVDDSLSRCINVTHLDLFGDPSVPPKCSSMDLMNIENLNAEIGKIRSKALSAESYYGYPCLTQARDALSKLEIALKRDSGFLSSAFSMTSLSHDNASEVQVGTVYDLRSESQEKFAWQMEAARIILQSGHECLEGTVCITDKAVHGDIPLGFHSIEYSFRCDKEGDGYSLSVRYSEGSGEACNVLRLIFLMHLIKTIHPELKDLRTEKASNGCRFTIAPLDFSNPHNKNGAIRILKSITSIFGSILIIDLWIS